MSLLNKAQIRRFILDYAERSRHQKFTRVAPEVYDAIEANVRTYCRTLVDRQPSKGQTIRTA